MVKKAIVFLADGTEEMEFTITVDVLRRAKVEVTVVGVQLKTPTVAECSRGVKIVPDAEFQHEGQSWKSADYDAVVVPGGMGGASTLRDDTGVQRLISSFYEKQKIVAFICAGTLVAKSSGIPRGHKVTSYPSVKDQLKDYYEYSEERVVVDQNIVTSRGPGTAFLFALTLVEQLVGKEVADNLRAEMLSAAEL
ncbi:class I glutamine amidotransferase-like protein [Zychaea mexicana]|uniref:class I glutamine amidotransferase-like protein n=1 Tax=Zychaea mexicana TaxID=64656 RepID=UPI0022FF0660|nr:class I glutamine amidotransferase-like protein [Zychaea mexicana]KAI9492933.1 class I glutamine amidotransferase-like protein [Zychaea mexicana]